MKDSLLQVKGISYSYDDEIRVLDQVSAEIGAGEKIAVLGANGAGKSTFFLNLNGVLKPDEGSILFHGREIDKKNLNELRKNVSIVFQDADNQIIASTVLAEVSFGPMNLKLPREEVKRRTYQALEFMNLLDFADRAPHYLSGGEKKRVSIADIIAMEPEIIIFDEPMTALDPMNQQVLEQVLEKLSKEGKSLMISTHDVDFAYRWAKRILVFSDGKIIADNVPERIFRDEDLLRKALLKRPVLFDLYDLLTEKKVIIGDSEYPKDVKGFSELLFINDKKE